MNKDFKLREWKLTDKESLAANADNVNIWNNVRDYFPFPYTVEEAEKFINAVLVKPKPATEFAIEVDGNAVGGVGIILNSDVERITAEIGYWIGEKFWNKGIITQAVKEMAGYSFSHLPIRKLYAPVFDFNKASHKVLEKSGFQKEAVLKEAAIKNGKILDLIYYGLIRE